MASPLTRQVRACSYNNCIHGACIQCCERSMVPHLLSPNWPLLSRMHSPLYPPSHSITAPHSEFKGAVLSGAIVASSMSACGSCCPTFGLSTLVCVLVWCFLLLRPLLGWSTASPLKGWPAAACEHAGLIISSHCQGILALCST